MKIYRIPKTAELISILFLLIALSTVTGCMPGDGKHSAEKPAGFFWGLWHGLIALISLIWGIFSDIRVYEIHNTGWWYDFGFCLTVGLGVYIGIAIILSIIVTILAIFCAIVDALFG